MTIFHCIIDSDLLALATPTTTPRKTKMALKRDWRGRLWLRCVALHRSRPHFIYTNFFSPRSRPHFIYTNVFSQRSRPHFIYTNFFSQLNRIGFLLHKLFLATALHLILTTRKFLLHKLSYYTRDATRDATRDTTRNPTRKSTRSTTYP